MPAPPPDYVAAYVAARTLRTARVQLQSREIGDHIYHPAGAHAELRNAIMRAKTPTEWFDTLEWIYGGAGNGAGEGIHRERTAEAV